RTLIFRAPAQAGLGEALFAQDRQPEAREAFQAALAATLPDATDSKKPNPGLMKCAARIYLTCPDPSIRDPRRAAELAEKAGDWKLQAHALYRQGQLEAALQLIEKWQSENNAPVLQLQRQLLGALCCWRLKRPEVAWRWYRNALLTAETFKPV